MSLLVAAVQCKSKPKRPPPKDDQGCLGQIAFFWEKREMMSSYNYSFYLKPFSTIHWTKGLG